MEICKPSSLFCHQLGFQYLFVEALRMVDRFTEFVQHFHSDCVNNFVKFVDNIVISSSMSSILL